MVSRYGGITGSKRISEDFHNINTAFENVQTEMDSNIRSINDLDNRIDNIVAQSGNDNTEIVDARGSFPVLGDRLNANDSLVSQKASLAYVNGLDWQKYRLTSAEGYSQNLTGYNLNDINYSGFFCGNNLGNAPDDDYYYVEVQAYTNNQYIRQTIRNLYKNTYRQRIYTFENGWSPWSSDVLFGNYVGLGNPEGVVAAPVGSIYRRTDGGQNSTLYVKQSGNGNTGWVAK